MATTLGAADVEVAKQRFLCFIRSEVKMWAPLAPPSQEWMAKQINQGRHPPALDEMIDMPIELWRAAYKAFRPHKNWKAWLAEDGHDIHRACFEIREFSGVKWFSPFPHPDQMDSPLDQLCSARRTSAELRIVIRDMRRIGKFSWQPGANDDPMDEDATAADADNNNAAAAAALQTPAVAPTSVEVTPIPDQPAMHKMHGRGEGDGGGGVASDLW